MPTSSRQNMLFYENLRRIRNFYWVDVGIDPYKCGLLEVRPFLLRSLYRLRKRNEPSKKGQRLEAQARQRYKIVPAVFSSISFLPRQKRYGPRSGGCGFANCTAPPAHSNCTSGGIPRHPAQKNSPFPGLLLRVKLSTCGCGLFTNFLFTTAQQMFHKIACGQI